MKVTVLDMQPIEPAVGGGRLRLLGLYSDMGDGIDVTYVGSFDWQGPEYRDHRIGPTLREIDVPLSAAHHRAAEELRSQVSGRTVIDSAFAQLAHLSEDFCRAARTAAGGADVVVFSHPWIYPIVKEVLDPDRQLIAYDAQNVEALLRAGLLDDGGVGTQIVQGVIRQEYDLCRDADLLLACSAEDREQFSRLYGIDPAHIRVVPNGVFARKIVPASEDQRQAARQRLALKHAATVLFLGSAYQPNVEAARYITGVLAPLFDDVCFVIAGGVGDAFSHLTPDSGRNIRVTGFISDEDKAAWLAAADIAINPMFSGSGTNIKMFDFMAAGVPVVTTPVGARGIEGGGVEIFEVVSKSEIAGALRRLIETPDRRKNLGACGRKTVEQLYAWERISPDLGLLLTRHQKVKKSVRKPFFSVVIPSYERPATLTTLVEHLADQSFPDFEVIIVDQSQEPWPDRHKDYGLDVLYIHTNVRGAVGARNRGAFLASGQVLAFIDDDCEPPPQWLAEGRPYFESRHVIGVEGLIKSAKRDDPEWRAVTNEGAAGGYMTANLFLRVSVFNRLNGFDLAFDNPHFREDTDLGWRALEHGEIPFSETAWVFHPPLPRSAERESVGERNRFFIKDALLYKKHPARYKHRLLVMEGHHLSNPYFRRYFEEGMQLYGVVLDQEFAKVIGVSSANKIV